MDDNLALEIENIKQRVYHLEAGSEDNKQAHTRMYGRLERIERENTATDIQYDQIIKTLEEMKGDIKSLKDKPSQILNLITAAAISVLISGVGMFFISSVLSK